MGVGYAQRMTDKLDRGVVAVPANGGNFVSWRIMGEEYYDTEYNLYRDGVKVNASPLKVSTLCVSVRLDWSDLWRRYLLDSLVLSLALVDDSVIVVSEILVCPIDDILLCYLAEVIKPCHFVSPISSVDE